MKRQSDSSANNTLAHRAVRGSFWVFLLSIIGLVISYARLIILARVLAPSDFGLVAIALFVIGILDMFSQTGFQAALIRKRDEIRPYLNVLWTVSILRGVGLFVVSFVLAPYATAFFNLPEAAPILQAVSVTWILSALINPALIFFQKELEFNKQFIYEFIGLVVDFAVSVFFVFTLKSVWAIVLGLLAGQAARLLSSYALRPYLPRFETGLRKAKELFSFGKWVSGTTIVLFLSTQIDNAFVGKLLGATELGFYQTGYNISNMPATNVTHVFSNVTFAPTQRCKTTSQRCAKGT
jgi:lipopolysaccharide exporter